MRKRVFNWADRSRWLSALKKYAADILTEEIELELKEKRPSCWSDNMSWLPDPSISFQFEMEFRSYYQCVRGFHGCRPISVRSYYDVGLLGQNEEALINQFRRVFSDVGPNMLERAMTDLKALGNYDESGKVLFCDIEDELTNDSGHYLIQGSEYVMSLAVRLDELLGTQRHVQRLRQIGVPTIFQVNIPVNFLPGLIVDELCKQVLSTWGQMITAKYVGDSGAPCYVIQRDVPPDCIVGHTHPREIVDPHNLRFVYFLSEVSCDVCDG